jgi:heme-degrading monooxygenase HmoA
MSYAVIFSSRRTQRDHDEYETAAQRMAELAAAQPGFLGIESARDAQGFGITVSYWTSLEAIHAWKAHAEHQEAQKLGKQKWYQSFKIKICKVEYER